MIVYVTATIISMIFAGLAAYTERISCSSPNAASIGEKVNKIASKRFFLAVCSALPLIIVASVRHEVGTDWPIYYKYFFGINDSTEAFSEPGFNLLNVIVYNIMPDFALMAAVCSIITYGFIFKAIYDQSVNYAFSILFFVLDAVYFNSMNQLRQMMTVAVFLYAIKFIKQRRFLPYLIICLILFTIHTSAIIFIPLYFLYGFKINIKVHVFLVIIGAVLMVPMNYLLRAIIAQTQYSWYLGSPYNELADFYVIGYVFSIILLILYDFYYCYGDDKDDKDYNFMVNVQFLGTLVMYLTESIPQVSRFLICFSIPGLLCIPKMLRREKVDNRRVVVSLLLIALYLVKLLYDIYVNGWYDIIPYQTIFDR